MGRELHPELFGDQILEQVEKSAPLDANENLRRRLNKLENQFQSLEAKVNQVALSFEQKIKAMQNQNKTSENDLRVFLENFQKQFNHLAGKVAEQKSTDHQVRDMLDRHNQIVQQFESRMHKMQKLSNEQEFKLVTYQTTLNEILKEIKTIGK